MAKNVCPKCAQVTISLGDENSIKCPICETVFESYVLSEPEEGLKEFNREDIERKYSGVCKD